MRWVRPIVFLRGFVIALIQAACVGLWFLFFVILTDTNSHYNEGSFLAVILDWGIFAGIIALNTAMAKYLSQRVSDFTSFFYGEKISEREVRLLADGIYDNVKPVIVIVHLVAILLFNFACGMLESDSGYIQTVILALPTVAYRIIFRVIGTVCFIISMVIYCKSSFKVALDICPSCGRVTGYTAEKIRTIEEAWTETDYTSSSYTTTEKIGELRDSSGNSCDVYGDVEHFKNDSYHIYHPGRYEYKYKCRICGYETTKIEKR